MAAVNIDSKLVKSDSITGGKSEIGGELVDTSEVMELQNGCACCTASDELAEVVSLLSPSLLHAADPSQNVPVLYFAESAAVAGGGCAEGRDVRPHRHRDQRRL
eukprot:2283716-Rhodomonas_salina.1